MTDIATKNSIIPSMSEESIEVVRQIEGLVMQAPQVDISTRHSLHAGMYARTVCIPKGVVIVGAKIKRSTHLVISGHVSVLIGDDEEREYKGYAVITASANRKQAFIAKEDTYLTMLFATNAKTIAEAEEEFTDEAHLLMSRQLHSINHITITED